jgi:sphingomyelin phosphodiesterase acid-like 3
VVHSRSIRRTIFRATVHLLLCAIIPAISTTSASARTPQAPPRSALWLSDIHFDPMFDSSLVAKLEAAEPSQWEGILRSSRSTSFSQYGQDTNYWLLQSALDQMRKTLPAPAVVLFTGDSLAHQFPRKFETATHSTDRERYRKFVLKAMQFLQLELRRRFPQSVILITPGNDDDVCGNYTVQSDGAFLQDTAELARNLARGDEAVRESWQKIGSFDVPNPTLKGARIISLNTVFFSALYHAKNFSQGCAGMNSDAPEQALAWLESRLKQASAEHQKVWLMFHIPPGIDPFSSVMAYSRLVKSTPEEAGSPSACASAVVPMWVPEWTKRFDELLEKYPETVVGSFAGHTHVDDFRLLGPSQFVLINSAISPVYNQNPAFRTFTFKQDGSLLDSTVYYLTNLPFASSTTAGEWQREYEFSHEWKLSPLDFETLTTLEGKIRSDTSVRNDWMKLYNVSSSSVFVPPTAVPGFYCAADKLSDTSYSPCYCPASSKPHADVPH